MLNTPASTIRFPHLLITGVFGISNTLTSLVKVSFG